VDATMNWDPASWTSNQPSFHAGMAQIKGVDHNSETSLWLSK
jgi:hypothetical protein